MTKKNYANPLGRSFVGFLTKEKVAKLTYTKKEAEKAKYEDLARKLNTFQASLIGILTGIKPNLDSIKGVNQESFLSTSLINDILTLNNAIEKILTYLQENEDYSMHVERLEIHISYLKRQLGFLNDELKQDVNNIEENEAKNAAAKKEKDKTKKKEELKKIDAEHKALLEKKSRVMDAINSDEHDENETRNKLNQINSLIYHNETLLIKSLATFERIWGSYSKEFLRSIDKNENPFKVEVDKKGLDNVLKLK